MSEDSDKAKDVEYYAATVNSWFATRLELDKSLLTLSAGGIGILVTLLSATAIKSVESLILYLLALLSFFVCLSSVLWIFRANAIHLQQINRNDKDTNEILLGRLDLVAVLSFALAVLFTSIIGVATAINSFNIQEVCMTKGMKNSPELTRMTQDSFKGMAEMRPASTIENSFGGAVAMKPQNAMTASPSAATETAAPPSANSQPGASNASPQTGQTLHKE